eukprot:TRINITY_DN14181_c0_g1_i3.p1 TRINITY_DN14181_c0_g1~~TRINITY_DN14181_c0_g1_i3.p1  ORF type:complete len:940 (+),score=233.56 TRINITY_DN14181_c0_g1_i3:70-2820(+)
MGCLPSRPVWRTRPEEHQGLVRSAAASPASAAAGSGEGAGSLPADVAASGSPADVAKAHEPDAAPAAAAAAAPSAPAEVGAEEEEEAEGAALKAGARVLLPGFPGSLGTVKSGPDEDDEYLVDWDSGETSSFHPRGELQLERHYLAAVAAAASAAPPGDASAQACSADPAAPAAALPEGGSASADLAEVPAVAVEAKGEEASSSLGGPRPPREPPFEEAPVAPSCVASAAVAAADASGGEIAAVAASPSASAPAEASWEELIERGEVRPDLGWFEAAAANASQTLAWLLSSRADALELLELRDSEKLTALHAASRAGAEDCIRLLLRRRADPGAQDRGRGTALHCAAGAGHVEATRLLLDPTPLWREKEGDADAGEPRPLPFDRWPGPTAADLWKKTPLHKAAEGAGAPAVIELLLDARANVESCDREGCTALHAAIAAGHTSVVEALMRVPAGSRDAVLAVTNGEGRSPLDLCVHLRQAAAGDVLLEAGARLNKEARGKAPVTLLRAVELQLPFLCTYLLRTAPNVGPTSAKQMLAQVDEDGRTPLRRAARDGPVEVLRRLLDGRCDVAAAAGAPERECVRPLHEAAAGGHVEALQLLLERRAAPESRDPDGQTALFYAATGGQVVACKWLVENAGSENAPSASDHRERTALHAAAQSGQAAVCEALLQCAGDEASELIATEDWEGFTAAHVAAQAGQAEVCRLLAAARAELYAALDFGVTTLQMAAERGHSEVLGLILDELAATHGGTASASFASAVHAKRVSDGRCAWLLAASEGFPESCDRLWKVEALRPQLRNAADRNRRSALLLAARGGHVDVCRWLLDADALTPPESCTDGSTAFGLRATDDCGWTALHLAAAEGRKPAIEWLLGRNADLLAVDAEGRRPREVAAARGQAGAEALLRDAEAEATAQAAA